jgi:3-methyladenine DNA glycosylase AlkD
MAGRSRPRVRVRAKTAPAAALANEIERRLAAEGTVARAKWDQAYLKSDLEHFGCKVPAMRALLSAFAKEERAPKDHAALRALTDALWSKRVYERRSFAVALLVRNAKLLVPEDLAKVEAMLRESKTWALVDELAVHVAGALVEKHPGLGDTLDRWAQDEDFWIRRSAMLALLRPLRAGGGDWERFARYADAMLEEKEFFVRKAIGWILREVSKKRPALVVEWVTPRVERVSGVTWREVVRRLPAKDRAALERRRRG